MFPDPRNLIIYGLAGLAALLLLACGVQTVRLSWSETELAQEQKSRSDETATREREAREATERLAALASAHAKTQQEIQDAFAKDLAARTADADSARADGERLREQIQRLASARPVVSDVDPAACVRSGDQSAALRDVLVGADKLAERLAGAAERHASEVRTLKRQIAADRAACSPGVPIP